MSALPIDDAPTGATTFADLGVPAPMARAMAERGLTQPFPIQAATIPDALAGRDVCGRAPTGSGKTIAFGIPLVLGVGRARARRPRGLVLVPTRELASQVAHELQQLAKPKGPWVEAFYGGVGFPRQVQALQRGVEIAVACPGRLADLINQGKVELGDVDHVVVDEADRMADMGFLPEVRRILDQCAPSRQTLLFSATLDGDVDVLITRYQTDPVRHELYHDDEGAARATHLFWSTEKSDRVALAADVIARTGPTVVFCRTKHGADRVARQLDKGGVPAAAVHGDRSQSQRERALRSFHDGKVKALVATDVAARGIHVDGVACVIHFDPPQDSKDYVHRSGRTARGGASGVVVTFAIAEKRKEVAQMQKELGYDVGLDVPDAAAVATAAAGTEAASRAAARPAGRGSERPVARIADLTGEGRAPAADGKRRPSGASRRKAKKLAEAEGTTPSEPRPWGARDSRDGRRAGGATDGRPRRAGSGSGNGTASAGRSGRGTSGGKGAPKGRPGGAGRSGPSPSNGHRSGPKPARRGR
jgi:superfamily II DNA/RNA helicase